MGKCGSVRGLRRPAVTGQPADRVMRRVGAAQRARPRGPGRPGRIPAGHGQAQLASGGGQRGQVGQHPLDLLLGQVGQHALGDPDGGLPGLEAGRQQRARPVGPQIAADRDALAAGHRGLLSQHQVLDVQNLGGVELEPADPGRPGQPERADVEPRAEQDHLPTALPAGGAEQLVEEYGPGHHPGPQHDGPPVPGRPGRRPTGGGHEGLGQRVGEQAVRARGFLGPDGRDRQRGRGHAFQRGG